MLLLICFFLAVSCGGSADNKTVEKNVVRVHMLSGPASLNPQIHSSATATHLCRHLFQTLINVDFETGKMVPILAKRLPEMLKKEDGSIWYTYELRDEASWDDGTPIVAEDVAFSFKVLKNPHVDNQHRRPYFDIVVDFLIDENNPKKFTLVYAEPYIQATWSMSDILIIPRTTYDPKGLLDVISIRELCKKQDETLNHPNLRKFASDFNASNYQREPHFIKGSGAYELMEWQTGSKIILNRKNTWWGDRVKNGNLYFQEHPKQIIYEQINDWSQALSALKLGKVDIMTSIPPKDFIKLQESEDFNQKFKTYNPSMYGFEYIAFNLKKTVLADKNVRHALTCLTDADKIIETLLYGMGMRVVGPVHPSKAAVNKDIVPYVFDPIKAKDLLESAGWKDSNHNGIRDKIIDGKVVELELELLYNSGNNRRKSIGLMLKEEARKIGIEINVVPKEWSVYIQSRKNKDFDLIVGAWGGSSAPSDPKQVWHTSSITSGSNFVSFGNEKSDAIIEKIRRELDEEQLNQLYFDLQDIIYDEMPYIFISAPKERIAIHRKFGAQKAFTLRPGFWEGAMK